jgi:hypothetical protein
VASAFRRNVAVRGFRLQARTSRRGGDLARLAIGAGAGGARVNRAESQPRRAIPPKGGSHGNAGVPPEGGSYGDAVFRLKAEATHTGFRLKAEATGHGVPPKGGSHSTRVFRLKAEATATRCSA